MRLFTVDGPVMGLFAVDLFAVDGPVVGLLTHELYTRTGPVMGLLASGNGLERGLWNGLGWMDCLVLGLQCGQ